MAPSLKALFWMVNSRLEKELRFKKENKEEFHG